jgi:hypothetical protein
LLCDPPVHRTVVDSARDAADEDAGLPAEGLAGVVDDDPQQTRRLFVLVQAVDPVASRNWSRRSSPGPGVAATPAIHCSKSLMPD